MSARWSGWALAGAAAALLLVAGCASDKPKPTPLQPLEAKIAGRAVWNLKLDGGLSSRGSARDAVLIPSVRGDTVFAASAGGELAALQAETGNVIWRAQVGDAVVAGVGSDGRFASVVTRGNEVVTFEAGRQLWRKRVPSTVATPPLVAGERVFVMGVNRSVEAFDALDGRRLWVYQRPGDALTLAQPGVLAAFRNTLLVGQGARLVGLDPLTGAVQWDVGMATPRGTNEVERLADLLGPLARVGDRVCARAFQSAVACADASRGALLWSRNVGGVTPVGSDAEFVFGADASDRVSAWRAPTGDPAWTNETLLFRGLSGGLAVGPVVVFGDSEGQVHFLSTQTGEVQLRLPTDGTAVLGAPVLAGNTLIVSTRGGGLFAFRPN